MGMFTHHAEACLYVLYAIPYYIYIYIYIYICFTHHAEACLCSLLYITPYHIDITRIYIYIYMQPWGHISKPPNLAPSALTLQKTSGFSHFH